jgi:FkbM family methyltransferase
MSLDIRNGLSWIAARSLRGLKSLFRRVERILNAYGYRITWAPPSLVRGPQAELAFDLEFVLAHLMLSKPDPFFIQIGANDGKTHDPLYKFVTEFGWSGILLEPLPDVFERLQANYRDRPNLKLLNAAIAEDDGSRVFYTVRPGPDTHHLAHQYSSFRRDVIEKQTAFVPDIVDRVVETRVRCISMKTLLAEVAGRHVDLLLIDTEGFDYEILKMIDFSVLRPAVICFERAHLSPQDQEAAVQRLIAEGYRLTCDNLDFIAYRPITNFGWRGREAAEAARAAG